MTGLTAKQNTVLAAAAAPIQRKARAVAPKSSRAGATAHRRRHGGSHCGLLMAVLSMMLIGILTVTTTEALADNPFALINCGAATTLTDEDGRVWQSDDGLFDANKGKVETTTSEISNTTLEALFQTARAFRRNRPAPYQYEIAVPAGTFAVELWFAEIDGNRFGTGLRIANVVVEGVTVATGFDIFQEANQQGDTAVILSTQVEVTDGSLTIELEQVKFNPLISAIAVFAESVAPTSLPSAAPTLDSASVVAQVNCGGAAFTDAAGNLWQADNYYSPLEIQSYAIQTDTPISDTSDGTLYATARVFRRRYDGPKIYEIPVPLAGEYSVALHFAEIDPDRGTVGKRTMDVLVEEELLQEAFDIVDATPEKQPFTAVVLATTVVVNDGYVTVELRQQKFNPLLSAIGVYSSSAGYGDASAAPSQVPSIEVVTGRPSEVPTVEPSLAPTFLPSFVPSADPSSSSSENPSTKPSFLPTAAGSIDPSGIPSTMPSTDPSATPSTLTSLVPTVISSTDPSSAPTTLPSLTPSTSTSTTPSTVPSVLPSLVPSIEPSDSVGSNFPSVSTTEEPSVVSEPSVFPSFSVGPSEKPLMASMPPSAVPSTSHVSSDSPSSSLEPSFPPTQSSEFPSASNAASGSPSLLSTEPSALPSGSPSGLPTVSEFPSLYSTNPPSTLPSLAPEPSPSPSGLMPSALPSFSNAPSVLPFWSTEPSRLLSSAPSMSPSELLTTEEPSFSINPSSTDEPSEPPVDASSRMPTGSPSYSIAPSYGPFWSTEPSRLLSSAPSMSPSELLTTKEPSFSINPSSTDEPSVPPVDASSSMPTGSPSYSTAPSYDPSDAPSSSYVYSTAPSALLSVNDDPSAVPSTRPSWSTVPSEIPSGQPSYSNSPSSVVLSNEPSAVPFLSISSEPTEIPSFSLEPSWSVNPSELPSGPPSYSTASQDPSFTPSEYPTFSRGPSGVPTTTPSFSPAPSAILSVSPSISSEPSSSHSPSMSPSASPAPSSSPQPSLSPTATPFQPILINSGGFNYIDVKGRHWIADDNDAIYSGGTVHHSVGAGIDGTADDTLYRSERIGTSFSYDIPLPEGNYEIILHFCELDDTTNATRVFDVAVEDTLVFASVDPYALSGWRYAFTLETVKIVTDGSLSIAFSAQSGNAQISAIEVNQVGPHLAHSVAGGPYTSVDTDGDGFALVPVDGVASHSHAPGRYLISWLWYEETELIGSGEITELLLSVGDHLVTLRVIDSGGNESAETCVITVLPKGFPFLSDLTPSSGNIEGGGSVTITGYGFLWSEDDVTVHFGQHDLTGPSQITVVNDFVIVVHSVPGESLGIPVPVSVSTPLGEESNAGTYTYINGVTVDWLRGLLYLLYAPTTLAFGPDLKLYVGTSDGRIAKLTLNDDFDSVVESLVSSVVADSDTTCPTNDCRAILGLAFDPLDSGLPNPPVYITHSKPFHGGALSSSGVAINGKISRISGANLDEITDIVTGLPVSDHDHVLNGIAFDDYGSLLFLSGGNTNGGVPGALSGTQLLKDNALSGALLVAHLADPAFDGEITYSADDDGDQIGGIGSVEVYASGLRNAYDFALHSNGRIYSTDNGSNLSYGDMSTSCTTSIPDIEEEDKLNLIVEGGYYGWSNRKRGFTDPRQCVWRSSYESSDDEYTAPLAILPASCNGIVEFQSNAFHGQLRGDLIVAKYKDELYRIVLSPDGSEVAYDPFILHPDGGLDVTQGPDGRLFVVKYKAGKIRYVAPKEDPSETMVIKSVFPRRGSQVGGSTLTIFGEKFLGTSGPLAYVGGFACPVLTSSDSKITCTLPGGSGTADVFVTNGSEAATFTAAYRYITGLPKQVSAVPTAAPSSNSGSSSFPSMTPAD